jgi:DNA polymerase-4
MHTEKDKKHRIIFHIDMDAFFASCEEAINPALKEKPLIVGGTKKDTRSIVACPNYLARAKGVRTAMPITHALLLVPEANFIRSTRGLYSDYAKRVRDIFYKYTPDVEPVSIDEAYMDVTKVMHLYNGDYRKLARMIKDEIKNTLKITCSIGIAANKLCAKIGSKFNKPDGVTVVPFGKEKEFLAKLPIERIPGVGKHTQEKLRKYGINLIEDILKFDQSFYDKEISMHTGWLLNVANGIDDREVHPESYEDRKSLSKENTFDKDINDIEFLRRELYSLMEKACTRLRKDNIKSRTLTVKVKYFDFKVNQKSLTRQRYSNLEVDFYEDALLLLNKLMEKRKMVRLLGVRFSELIQEDNSLQETMFADNEKFEKVSEKIDKLRDKYNFNIIKFGKNF